MHDGVGYLTLGVLVTAGLWLARRAQRRRQPTWASAISAMDPAGASVWCRFLDIVPLPLILLALVALLWQLAMYAYFSKPWWMRGGPSSAREPDPEFAVLTEHLLVRLTVEQIESREQVDDPLAAVPALPFGHLNASWRRLLEQLVEGDEFWSFRALWSAARDEPVFGHKPVEILATKPASRQRGQIVEGGQRQFQATERRS